MFDTRFFSISLALTTPRRYYERKTWLTKRTCNSK